MKKYGIYLCVLALLLGLVPGMLLWQKRNDLHLQLEATASSADVFERIGFDALFYKGNGIWSIHKDEDGIDTQYGVSQTLARQAGSDAVMEILFTVDPDQLREVKKAEALQETGEKPALYAGKAALLNVHFRVAYRDEGDYKQEEIRKPLAVSLRDEIELTYYVDESSKEAVVYQIQSDPFIDISADSSSSQTSDTSYLGSVICADGEALYAVVSKEMIQSQYRSIYNGAAAGDTTSLQLPSLPASIYHLSKAGGAQKVWQEEKGEVLLELGIGSSSICLLIQTKQGMELRQYDKEWKLRSVKELEDSAERPLFSVKQDTVLMYWNGSVHVYDLKEDIKELAEIPSGSVSGSLTFGKENFVVLDNVLYMLQPQAAYDGKEGLLLYAYDMDTDSVFTQKITFPSEVAYQYEEEAYEAESQASFSADTLLIEMTARREAGYVRVVDIHALEEEPS